MRYASSVAFIDFGVEIVGNGDYQESFPALRARLPTVGLPPSHNSRAASPEKPLCSKRSSLAPTSPAEARSPLTRHFLRRVTVSHTTSVRCLTHHDRQNFCQAFPSTQAAQVGHRPLAHDSTPAHNYRCKLNQRSSCDGLYPPNYLRF